MKLSVCCTFLPNPAPPSKSASFLANFKSSIMQLSDQRAQAFNSICSKTGPPHSCKMVCQGHVHATSPGARTLFTKVFRQSTSSFWRSDLSAGHRIIYKFTTCVQDANTCWTCWSLLFCPSIFHLKTRNRNGCSNLWHVDRFGSMKKSWMSIIILKYAIILFHLNSSYKTALHQFCNVSNFFNVVLLSCALVGRIAPFIQDILQHSTWQFEIIAGW